MHCIKNSFSRNLAQSFAVVAALAIASTQALAAGNHSRQVAANSYSGSNNYSSTNNSTSDYGSTMGIGLGLERIATVDNQAINMMHGLFTLGNSPFALGIGFGFVNDFNIAAFGPDLRYTFLTHGASQVFAMYNAFFFHGAGAVGGNGCGMGLLLGFDYGLTSYLRMSFAYGFEFGMGSAFASHFGVTNNGFEGNFGLHWYL